MYLARKPWQARYAMNIPGITKEMHLSDMVIKDFSDPLDNVEQDDPDPAEDIAGDAREAPDPIIFPVVEEDLFDPEAQRMFDRIHGECSSRDLMDHYRAILPEAMKVLTDKQALALWCVFGTDLTQRVAAAALGVPQSGLHESVYGKDGVGGSLRKLLRYFVEHPIK